MYIVIEGKAIRHNIHAPSWNDQQPVLRACAKYGMGAYINGRCEVIYDPDGCPDAGAQVWVQTDAPVRLTTQHISPPQQVGWCVSTNTIHHRGNRKTMREGLDRPMKPVIALRWGRSGKADYGDHLLVPGPSVLIYANPLDPAAHKLRCGAYVYLVTTTKPVWLDDGDAAYQPLLLF